MKALSREVKVKESQISDMRKKRRKTFKNRKILTTAEYDSQSIHHTHPQNAKDLERGTEIDTSEATFPPTEDLGKSDKNGGEHRCASRIKEENDSPLCKENKQFLSASEEKVGKKSDCPPLAYCHQQERLHTVVTFGNPKGSLLGKITLQNFPDSVETFKSTKGKITTEMKCGTFNIKVEVEENSLSDHGTNLTQRKKSCPKIQWRYPGKQIWRCPCFRYYHSRYQTLLVGHTRDRKQEASSKFKATVASSEDPSLKVNIVGGKIKVLYVNKKQNLLFNRVHSKQRKKKDKYGNYNSNVTTKRCSKSPSLSAQGVQSEAQTFQNYEGTDCSLTPSTPFPFPLPPPDKFADCKGKNANILTDSLAPESNKNELGMLFAVFDTERVQGTIPQQKNYQSNECTATKEKISEIETVPPYFVHGPLEMSDTDSFKEPLENGGEMEEWQESILINQENTMLEPYLLHNTGGLMDFMGTTAYTLSQTQGGKEANAHSLPSLKVQHVGAKASSIFSKSGTHPEYPEFSTPSSSVSSCFGVDDVKSLSCSTTTNPSHSDLTTYCLQPKESTNDAFDLNHYVEYMTDSENPWTPLEKNFNCMPQESSNQMPKDLQSINQSFNKHSLTTNCTPGTVDTNSESARFLSVCQEEHKNFSEGGFNEDTAESGHHASAQELLKLKSVSSLTLASPLPSSSSRDYVSPHNRTDSEIMECTQRQPSVKQPSITTHETEGASKKWKGSMMTGLTKTLKQKLVSQSGSKVIRTACGSMLKKDLEDLSNPHGNSGIFSLWDTEEPNVEDEYRDIFEVLSNSNYIKACFQKHFPPITGEDSLPVPSLDNQLSNLEAFIKETLGNSDWEEIILRPIIHKENSVECQMGEFSKLNSERDEKSSDQKTDIPLSPQKARILKDWKLEMNKFIKLSNELPSRDARASDSSQDEAIDQWAKRRKQFKENKKCSSVGGSSFASNITEGSITSEDGHSVDLSMRNEIEEKGFYTENFHSASWVFRDDENPENSPRCLSKRLQPVAVRERTVRISKGTGDYPCGFRIQFSKPILVTEVDTNSAAEEAGLLIGDIVLAINGTDVTSVAHSEAVNLARKGPDVLTLVVGSDISRCPNTPWPTCRGYLHKRTHSGFLKGWRKRWFVLKHDGYLLYYKRKKDEGKCRPLDVTKLEGAEVEIDSSLGKPFVFKCVPQSGTRTFCLCATSNQEMKRWLEAMDKAAHPVCQNHVWIDVTLHNSSLPPLAIKNPECLGLLHQLDRNQDVWTQYYCILKDACLYFYASIRSTQATGGLYLQGYSVSEQVLSFKQSVIELNPPSEEFKTFYFCAENETENKRWITALKASIRKWLRLHQAIEDFMNWPVEETRMQRKSEFPKQYNPHANYQLMQKQEKCSTHMV
ncbi:LOW QUALITY PROTEIN: uncharacterized protein [Notamacropus eugenii]|uniref:LOW QUALITY PROTEIN: uncharacterized protein n=1 Tax=Notamacropus eugenii TaxID=9315 RepID=UPI003B66F471